MIIIVGSQQEAIDAARLMQQAAESIMRDYSRKDIEQTIISNKLCSLRDNIQIAMEPGGEG